ncbi:RNA-directed DNA polymerase from mobile element jockey [Clarias magur]|uniref:RNA-directed DNA polymerase from mobile element jockey n=1 Tax=Clarias magur TaxID=1594786 RepID=A0A8J4UMS7_CLAMG|nr:RNA-directed DNA polymerase from mobile element jockey [Clarias magur]
MALTFLVTKAMERVVKNHINKTGLLMDRLQFAYRIGRGVDDKVLLSLLSGPIKYHGSELQEIVE